MAPSRLDVDIPATAITDTTTFTKLDDPNRVDTVGVVVGYRLV